jgi:hypothetical protein
MRHFTLRFGAALLTFIIGIVAAYIWHEQRPSPTKQVENVAQQPIKAGDTSVPESLDEGCDPAFEGRYSNYDYAFSVQIPKGMIGFGSCDTNHGFGIDLSNPTSRLWTERTRDDIWPQSYLYVDASYNSAEWKSLDEAMTVKLEYLKDDGVKDIELVSKTSTHLAKLRSIRFVARYNKSGEAMVNDVVLAFRERGDILYTLDLTTPISRYDKDRGIITQMQQAWRLQPLP